MSNLRSLLPALSLVMLALAACGGASATTPAGSGGQPTKPAQPAATRTVASTPINATPTTSTPASTNSAAKVVPCAQLVPPDELKLILGVNPMTANEQVSPDQRPAPGSIHRRTSRRRSGSRCKPRQAARP